MNSKRSFESLEPHRRLTAMLGCLYSAYIILDSQTIFHYLSIFALTQYKSKIEAKPYRYMRWLGPVGVVGSIASYFDHKYNFLTAATFIIHFSACSPRFVFGNRLRGIYLANCLCFVVISRLYYERVNSMKPHEHFTSMFDFKPRYYIP